MNEIIHLELTKEDVLEPCPLCGATEIGLANTWTAHYWLECYCCGCEMRVYDGHLDAGKIEDHQASKAAVIKAWNQRSDYRREVFS